MAGIRFLGVKDNGSQVLAHFKADFIFMDAFCLNEDSLRTRIANLKAQNLNTEIESLALASIVEFRRLSVKL